MKVVAIVLVLGALVVSAWLTSRSPAQVPQIIFYKVGVRDVGTVVEQLKNTGSDTSYGIFAFFPSDATDESHVELQFSIEKGVIGFDWVLLGEIKERDSAKFVEHAKSLGHSTEEQEVNNVRYIRVVDGDLVNLCVSVMESFYGAVPGTQVELIAKGFTVTGFPLSTQ